MILHRRKREMDKVEGTTAQSWGFWTDRSLELDRCRMDGSVDTPASE